MAVLALGRAGYTALTNRNLSMWAQPAPRLYTTSTFTGRTWQRWEPPLWTACVNYAAAWTPSTTSFGTVPTGKWLHAGTSTWLYSRGARVILQLDGIRRPCTSRSTLISPFRQAWTLVRIRPGRASLTTD